MQTWNQRLAEAIVATTFCPADVRAANSWAMCKVGEMVVQRRLKVKLGAELGEPVAPVDSALYYLGQRFGKAVRQNDILEACKLAEQIEARAVELHNATSKTRDEDARLHVPTR